jgi:hypothetical protein
MSPVNPAYVMQGRSDHPASLFRNALGSLSNAPVTVGNAIPAAGINPYLLSRLAVTGLGSMNVTAGSGAAYVTATAAFQGQYFCLNNGAYNVAIPTSSSTQWRTDYIALVVTDAGDGSATWDIVDVPGTFSSSAPGAFPALPNNAFVIASVAVTPNMTTTNGAGTITDRRQYNSLAGVIPCLASQKPNASCGDGTMWYETDTDQLGVYVNGVAQYVSFAQAVDTWHDLRPGNAGWNGTNTGVYPPQYRISPDGSKVEIFGSMRIPNSGTLVGVPVFANNMPSQYRPASAVRIPLMMISPAAGSYSKTPQAVIHNDGSITFEGVEGQNTQVVFMDGSYPLPVSGLIPTS